MDDPILSQAATIALAAPSTSSSPDEGRFLPGTLFAGRYRIISLLGRGGMGEVYRATDLTLAQPVALKFLSDASSSSPRMLELFHNEVRIARQVSHPNVCRVYDVGEAAGMPYISMEYVDGEDLETLLQRIGRLPSHKALEIARKICAGVAAAHDKGVLHRDLKPANVMLDKRGNVVVMDFGLAAVAQQLHGAEARSGTPAYMAPEQLRGEEVTAKSDIYALGLMLYELFTGKRAYEAGTLAGLIRLQENAHIVSMSSLAADVDISVERAIRRCLDPIPAKRPATALAVAAALPGGDPLAAALAAGETPSPDLVAASGKTEGLPLKRSVPLVLALAALIVAVPFARTGVEMHSLVPIEFSAEELAAKIRDHAKSFGYTAPPIDRKYDFHWVLEAIGDAGRRALSLDRKRRWFQAEPPFELGYRESPLPLIALPDGEVSDAHPAPTVSGMLEAWVNSKGELRRFRAVPPQVDRAAVSYDIDTNLLSRATGFELSQWQDTPPRFTPLYAFDRLKAWKGRHPVLDVDVTVQASAWRGRITEVNVIWPWTAPGRMPEARSGSTSIDTIVERLTSALVFVFSLFLAVRNLRAGRGDLRGAARLAVAYSLSMAAAWLFRAHWTVDFGMIKILETNAEDCIVSGALVWLLYIALEPAVRARWPHSIVTWSRVLVGRWRDPLVAAHVLYGALAGTVIAAFFLGSQWYGLVHGSSIGAASANAGVSARYWISDVLGTATNAAEFGLVVVFAIFCFRVMFRKDWIASVAAAALFSLQEGEIWHSGGYIDFAFFLMVFTALVFVLLRLGLVATMVALFFVNALLHTPGAQTLSKPYEWAVIMYPALALVIAVWAFWRTSEEQLLSVSPVQPAPARY
jgi:predicted Ser/Thr protein kinase